MEDISKGCCYWVTGLAGSGKTTIGSILYKYLKKTSGNTVYLDGDTLREVLNAEKAYTREDRIKLAFLYSRFCKMLTDQGFDVVCTTISMFNDVRSWNRDNLENYCEIYIKVPFDVLVERDQKGLYTGCINGDKKNVVGVDQSFEEPRTPDIVLENNGNLTPEELFEVLKTEILQVKNV